MTRVMEVQSLLVFDTHQNLPETGHLDPVTRKAMQVYQATNGLKGRRFTDHDTLLKLEAPVQEALQKLGHTDAEFADALWAFQKSEKLIPDGRMGPSSRKALEQALGILAAQEALKAQNLYDGPLDGMLRPACVKALRTFQDAHKLTVNGELDAATQAALRDATAPPRHTPAPVVAAAPAPTPAPHFYSQPGFVPGGVLGMLLGAISVVRAVRCLLTCLKHAPRAPPALPRIWGAMSVVRLTGFFSILLESMEDGGPPWSDPGILSAAAPAATRG
ncbi:MAG: peptidoglycan-binding domain-containing protein [Candidatus Xenobia bacterium]